MSLRLAFVDDKGDVGVDGLSGGGIFRGINPKDVGGLIVTVEGEEVGQITLQGRGRLLVLPFAHIEGVADG